MSINKKDVIKLLEKIAMYMEIKGENPFKISAYRKAAAGLEQDHRSLADIADFNQIPGIGKGTGAVITEYLEKGQSTTLVELKEEVPSGLIPLLKLPGLGGKRIAKLYKELQIVDATTLKEACENGAVEQLSGFGKKTVENILAALDEAGKRPERLPIAMMIPVAERIEAYLETIPQIIRFSLAGSLRRMRETIGDIDFIIATDDHQAVREQLIQIPGIKEIISQGETKVSLTLEETYDINVDFRLVKDNAFPTTLHHFTGSKEHNVMMRQLAKSRAEKINEYGVVDDETGEIRTFSDETAFFKHFNLPFIAPEMREANHDLEKLTQTDDYITLDAIRGDLHMHTTWSDGAQSVQEMVDQARRKGYEYIAITDHSKYLRVANGLDETRLRKQREVIHLLNEQYNDIHIFAGVEMDILPDGSLDFSDDFLREMDYVIGAIHSSFNQSEEKIMYRLFQALENPYVSLIAHPTGRLIGSRAGYSVNMEKLIDKAKETNTTLEINANPNRLDLSSEWAELAQVKGAQLAINTDAHNYEMMEHMKYGVGVAKKALIKKETVINTWSKESVLAYFNRNK